MGCGGSNAARVSAPGVPVPTQGARPDEDGERGTPVAGKARGDVDKEAGFQHLPHWVAGAREVERDYLRDAGSQHHHWGTVARAMERGYLRDALREFET